MALQIRNGDTVLVRGTVVGECSSGPKVAFNEVTKEDGCNTLWIEPRTIVSVEPRALQVGDRVRPSGEMYNSSFPTLQIKSICGDYAWTCTADSNPSTVKGTIRSLSDLLLAP